MGGDGDDTIFGGLGWDEIIFETAYTGISVQFNSIGGGTASDGQGGTDTFSGIEQVRGTDFNDLIVGGAGTEEITGGAGKDVLNGRGGEDALYGQGGKDKLIGGNGNDHLDGGAKSDNLKGGNGSDTLFEKAGNDKIYGGKGSDEMTGGNGSDTFIFKSVNDSKTGNNVDVILDFEIGSDMIDMSSLSLTFIGSDAFSGAAEIRITNDGTDSKIKVDADGDGNIDMKIIVEGVVGLTEDDFLL